MLSIGFLVVCGWLVGESGGLWPASGRAAGCRGRTSGVVSAGDWTGEFSQTLTARGRTGSGAQLSLQSNVSGQLAITVACTGNSITRGTITDLTLSVRESLTTRLGFRRPRTPSRGTITVGGSCSGSIPRQTLTGLVSENPNTLFPEFSLTRSLASRERFSCSGELAPALSRLFAGVGGGETAGAPTTMILVASGDEQDGVIQGTTIQSSGGFDPLALSIANLQSLGAPIQPVVTQSWILRAKGPVVTGVEADYGQLFLTGAPGVAFQNTFTANVNWRGSPPGTVTFKLGPATQEVPAQGATTSASFDMGALDPGPNVLSVVAENDLGTSRPAEYTIRAVVVPAWARPLDLAAQPRPGARWTLPFGSTSARGSTQGSGRGSGQSATQGTAQPARPGVVIYRSRTEVGLPTTPYAKGVQVPGWVPLLAGYWGIKNTQLMVSLAVTSATGTQSAPITGEGGFALGETRDYTLTFSARPPPADPYPVPPTTVTDLEQSELDFVVPSVAFIDADPPLLLRKRVSLAGLLPITALAGNLPVVREVVEWLIGDVLTVQMEATGTLRASAELGLTSTFGSRSRQQALAITDGLAGSALAGKLELRVEPYRGWYVAGGVALSGRLVLRLVPLELDSCTFDFVAFARLRFGGRPGPEARSAPVSIAECQPSGTRTTQSAVVPGATTSTSWATPTRLPGWQPERAVAATERRGSATVTTLVEGASPDAEPSLALGPGGRMALAWAGERSGLASARASEIRLRLFDGARWTAPIAVTANETQDETPSVAFDARGNVVVVWSRAAPAGTQLTRGYVKGIDLAYAVFDSRTGRQLRSGTVTHDDAFDFGQRLGRGRDGSLWLAWESSPSGELMGNARAPNRLYVARWEGERFLEPETAAGTLRGTLYWSFAARDRDRLLLAADSDTDGNLRTAGDREIVTYERRDGWRRRRITDNATADVAPRAAFTAAGKPVLAWLGDGQVLGVAGDLEAKPAVWLDRRADVGLGLGEGSLVLEPSGGLTLVWPHIAAGASSPALLAADYDPATGGLTKPRELVAGPADVRSVTAFPAGGRVVAAFERLKVAARPIKAADGSAVVVPAPAEAGALSVLRFPGGRKPLTLSSVSSSSARWIAFVLVGVLAAGAGLTTFALIWRRRGGVEPPVTHD